MMRKRIVAMGMSAVLSGFIFAVCGCEEADEYIDDLVNGIHHQGTDTSGCQGFCGDGIVQTVLDEACDDGNNVNFDGCSADCQQEDSDTGFCGDGIVQTELGEACDDGNNVNFDDCSADCQLEDSDTGFCGDGIVQTELGEVCDDGNNEDGDCSDDCKTFLIV